MSGVVGGVNQLQILRDELDIDQPAGHVFEIPSLAVAFLGRDRLAHFDDVGGDHLGIAWPAQHRADQRLDARGKWRRGRDDPGARERHVLPGPGFVFLIARQNRRCWVASGPERPDGRSRMSTW